MHSTGDRDGRANCQGKKIYLSFTEAKRIVKRIYRSIDRPDGMNGHMHAYRCRVCSAWHLGGGIEAGRKKR